MLETAVVFDGSLQIVAVDEDYSGWNVRDSAAMRMTNGVLCKNDWIEPMLLSRLRKGNGFSQQVAGKLFGYINPDA